MSYVVIGVGASGLLNSTIVLFFIYLVKSDGVYRGLVVITTSSFITNWDSFYTGLIASSWSLGEQARRQDCCCATLLFVLVRKTTYRLPPTYPQLQCRCIIAIVSCFLFCDHQHLYPPILADPETICSLPSPLVTWLTLVCLAAPVCLYSLHNLRSVTSLCASGTVE
jgi:hypothetical protein